MSTVTILEHDIPVWDYMTGHEWEQVETLLADPPKSDLRTDLTVLKIFIESRTDGTLDIDEVMSHAIPNDDIAAAVEKLTVPFANARRQRAERRLKTQASLLTTEALKQRQAELTEQLTTIQRLLSERGGRESKPSSGTTTPGSASRGGGKGRSKKPSN